MKSQHVMPFGAALAQDGGVTFRLWAPDAHQVDVLLDAADGETAVTMQPLADGWFAVHCTAANASSRYRFRCDGGTPVPDPAARFNPLDVHGPSEVTDPLTFDWQDTQWRGRPWEEAVIYELHVGCFTAAGSFTAIIDRLDHLLELGVTAVELMPVADFPGARNWGYDGVLPFAPDSRYGSPDDLKRLVQAAHQKGLMIFLDVVYNHFGPEGNYLHVYASRFFNDRHSTPWGAALNFDAPGSRTVRDFFIHNALYWLDEFHFDGLRFDAVHAIKDDSRPDILEEIAAAVRQGPGRDRPIHLVLENDANQTGYLRRTAGGGFTAQWNDDFHHAMHVLISGETEGYYADYAVGAEQHLGRCLSEGFAYQGELSVYRDRRPRGEPSRDLPPTAFVNFLQNHDQIGNRAGGERIAALVAPRVLRAAVAVQLLSPAPPLLFMGEEFGASQPFLFFCDFGPELATAVTEGRRREFAHFARFSSAAARATIPDPNAPATFEQSRLNWRCFETPAHQDWLALYRGLLALRHREIVPRLRRGMPQQACYRRIGPGGLDVRWRLEDGTRLILLSNLSDTVLPNVDPPQSEPLYGADASVDGALAQHVLPPWTTVWWLEREPVD